MRYLLALCALLATAAYAQTPTNTQRVSWVGPTQYTDGTAIPATAVLTYNVYAKLGTAAEVKFRSSIAMTSLTTGPQPVGQRNCYTVTVLVNGANESARSPEACGVVVGLTAKPVTTVVIQ